MKLRVRYFLLILFVTFCLAYLLGCKLPIFCPLYNVNQSSMVDPGVHLGNIINLFVCIGSFVAIIVALFKSEIEGMFKSVDLKAAFENSTVFEVLNEESSDNPTARQYYNNLFLTNYGNINALNCEVQIDEIKFKRETDLRPTSLYCEKLKLPFISDSAFISANGGYQRIRLFEITSSQDPDGNIKMTLKLGENIYPITVGGTWTIKCCANLENAKPYVFTCEIKWDGMWHARRNEMQINFKVI